MTDRVEIERRCGMIMGAPPRPHDTHVAARQGPSRHPHMGAVHL